MLIATDAFNAYKKATGATADTATGLLKVSKSQFSALKSLDFKIGSNTYSLSANAQIWPRSLNSQIGGDSGSIYLVVADLGSDIGSGLDFINGYAFLFVFNLNAMFFYHHSDSYRLVNATTPSMIPPISKWASPRPSTPTPPPTKDFQPHRQCVTIPRTHIFIRGSGKGASIERTHQALVLAICIYRTTHWSRNCIYLIDSSSHSRFSLLARRRSRWFRERKLREDLS